MLKKTNKNPFKKRNQFLIGIGLVFFIAVIVGILIIHISKAKEIEFISVKDNFRADENLAFRFKYRGEGNYKDLGIKVVVFDYKGKEIAQLTPSVSQGENGEILIDLTEYFRNFKPGKYKLKFEIEDKNKGKIFVQNKDFTWGVLAINVNKSIYPVRNNISNGVYPPNETAYIQMAALRDDGHTICNARLELRIWNLESGIETILSTENSGIKYSGKCGPDNVTDVPDYFAYYQIPNKTGTYEMKLTNLNNGYEITDSFEVRDSVPFDIERIGPTRIYPPATYEMTMRVRVNQDFVGEVKEYVPESFKILNAKPYTLNPGQIIWQVDWKTGEIYELKYTFDAPDISPYLYLLGPLELFSVNPRSNQRLPRVSEGDLRGESAVFAEQRRWQIAADSPGDILSESFEGAGYENAGWVENVSAGCTVDEDSTDVTPPANGGSETVKIIRVAPNYSARTAWNDGSNHTITYTTVFINPATEGLSDGQEMDQLNITSSGGTWAWGVRLYKTGVGALLRFRVYLEGSALGFWPASGNLNLNQWYRVDVKYDTVAKTYEFRFDETPTFDGSLSATPPVPYYWTLGAYTNASFTTYFDLVNIDSTGYVSFEEVRIKGSTRIKGGIRLK